jgi:hypothetical protein
VPDFTPEAVRGALTAAGYQARNPEAGMAGFRIADARETLGHLLVEALIPLADPPHITEEERKSQGELMLGCLLALRMAGYTGSLVSSTLIAVTGNRQP